MLQSFRQEERHPIRWWLGLEVAKKWMINLWSEDAMELTDEEVELGHSPSAQDCEGANGNKFCPTE